VLEKTLGGLVSEENITRIGVGLDYLASLGAGGTQDGRRDMGASGLVVLKRRALGQAPK
jgi:hypothetical protein